MKSFRHWIIAGVAAGALALLAGGCAEAVAPVDNHYVASTPSPRAQLENDCKAYVSSRYNVTMDTISAAPGRGSHIPVVINSSRVHESGYCRVRHGKIIGYYRTSRR